MFAAGAAGAAAGRQEAAHTLQVLRKVNKQG